MKPHVPNIIVLLVVSGLVAACDRQPIEQMSPFLTLRAQSVTEILWRRLYTTATIGSPGYIRDLGLSDQDSEIFLAFAAEAKERIRESQIRGVAEICAQRSSINSRLEFSRAFREMDFNNELMEEALVWELLDRLGDDVSRSLVERVHELRLRGENAFGESGDLALLYLLDGRDMEEVFADFCATAEFDSTARAALEW